MANRELSKEEWLSKAEAYCARAEHCAADVRRKLYEWGAPAKTEDFAPEEGRDLFDFIEKNLYAANFLNDTRFCQAYVHDKVEYQGWGRLKIKAGLRAMNLPGKEIEEALDSIDEIAYFRNLRALIKQRKNDPEDKLLRFLAQRGFTYEEIKNCE